jgi:outer membrane protein TolC
MIRISSVRTTIAAIGMLSLGAAQAMAQISETRLQELIKEAADAVKQPPSIGVSTIPVPGEGPVVQLTLDDAVAFALERNLDIAVQRLNPQLQDIAISSAYSFYSPTLTSSISQGHQVGIPQSQLQLASGGQGRGATTEQLLYNAGIVQNFRQFGTQLAATFNNGRNLTDSNNALFNPSYTSNWSAVITQPLLRGFRTDALRRQISISRVNRDISDVQLRASITNVVSNVRNAYWDYVFATQAVDVARESLELATKLVQDNQTRVEIGTMAPIDVVQAQAEQATRRQVLVSAESTRQTAELALKRLIVGGTQDINWRATLDPVERPEFRPEPVDVETAIRRALSERTDLAVARKNIENNNLTVRFLRDQALPEVEVQATYGTQGIGGTRFIRQGAFGEIAQTIPGGIADSFQSLFNQNYPRWTVALNVSYPIGTSTQDAAVARSRVQLSQVEAQMRSIELQIATEVTNASIQVRNTAESVQAAQAARELSERRLEAEQSKFEVGMSVNYYVVQAQRDLNDARNSELRQILNYRKALVEFERLQQTTLQSANVTVVQTGAGAGTTQATGF